MPGMVPTRPGAASHGLARSRCARRLLLATAIALAVAVAAGPAPAGDPFGVAAPAAVEAAVRCLVNGERAAHDLAPARPSPTLALAARRHGTDMVARRYFAHVSPSGGTVERRARRAGYITQPCWAVGEDLGTALPETSTARAVVAAWMASPAHRAVILEPAFREIGVAVLGRPPEGDAPGTTFVLEMGVNRPCRRAAAARARVRAR
jgi:uncharacterized protein YkwD